MVCVDSQVKEINSSSSTLSKVLKIDENWDLYCLIWEVLTMNDNNFIWFVQNQKYTKNSVLNIQYILIGFFIYI